MGLARRKEKIEEFAKQLEGKPGKLFAVQVDMMKEEDILNAFKWTTNNVGPVHILINNAGMMTYTSLSDGDTDLWRRVLDTNIMGLCIATREAIRIMKSNNIDGHIVHMNSVVGHKVFRGPITTSLYVPSKYAVTALAELLRLELNGSNSKIKITVCLIYRLISVNIKILEYQSWSCSFGNV